MGLTKIEWTERTWNPITGCSKISEGCVNCYAERMSKRLAGQYGYDSKEPFKVTFHANRLEEPLKIKKPSMFFVCSMGDIFHDDVHEDWIDEIFDVIKRCPQHIFQILTKRPDNISQKLWGYRGGDPDNQPQACGPVRTLDYDCVPDNVWFGTTVENQKHTERIKYLNRIRAKVRFVSIEPMLGPIDITNKGINNGYSVQIAYTDYGIGIEWTDPGDKFIGLEWVVCGGETGPGARPMHPDWVRDLRDQCAKAGVPFFFKQWGEWAPCYYGSGWDHYPGEELKYQYLNNPPAVKVWKVGKKRAGRLLDGREWNEMPDFSTLHSTELF